MGWLGLLAYLFLGLLSSQGAMAISSALAGHHGLTVVQDGSHQDIIFTHGHIDDHHEGQAHSHEPVVSVQHSLQASNSSVFSDHKQPHPDHRLHVAKSPEQISAQVPLLNFDTQYFYHHISMTETVPIDCFLKTVSIQAFPQPPPLKPSIHRFLNTIILQI